MYCGDPNEPPKFLLYLVWRIKIIVSVSPIKCVLRDSREHVVRMANSRECAVGQILKSFRMRKCRPQFDKGFGKEFFIGKY